MECGGALDASCGGGTVHAAEGDALGVCSTNGLDGDNGKHDAGSGGILAMDESNRALHADDNSGALCTGGGSNVPSGGNNATVLEGAGSSNVLAAGEGDGTLHGDDNSGAPRAYIGIDMLEQRWRPRCTHPRQRSGCGRCPQCRLPQNMRPRQGHPGRQ
jgi:hypothetical protein